MALLQIKKKKKVIGAFLPLDLIEYMTLYCMGYGGSNSKLIEGLLIDWKDGTNFSDEDFINAIVERAKEEFEIRKKKNVRYSLKSFVKELGAELIEKGITKDELVKPILSKLLNEKED